MTNYRQTMAETLEFMYLMREYKLAERELTDDEKKKREEIAQDMDDADFKDRYGDRWKEVKMAVATKVAKGEKMEGFEFDEAKEWVVYNNDNGKKMKEFSNKISADRHMDKLNKKYEASGKLPYRVMQTEELEIDEAKYEYDGKVVKISKKEFAKVHKDYKDTTKGKEMMLVLDPKLPGKALVSAPVVFEEKSNESVQRVANAISFYEVANKLMSARQLKDPKKEMMVSLKGKVEVINKSDWAAYKKKGYIQAEQQEVDLNEAKPEYEVKYAKRKSGPIKVTKFMTLDQAKEFLAKVRKDGMNGIISKGGKPIKEEVELDEKTKWKMGDGRPRGGAYIENERFWDLPKDSLEYIIKDAGEAIKANPKARKATTGRGNWADQINDAASVLGWRKKNGIKEEAELDLIENLIAQIHKKSGMNPKQINNALKKHLGFSPTTDPLYWEVFIAKNPKEMSKAKESLVAIRGPQALKNLKNAVQKIIKEEVELGEAFWKVSIPDMPPIFVEAGSASEIKSDMRTKLKSDVFKELEIERVSKTEMIKKYREMAKGDSGEEESKEEAELDEIGAIAKMAIGAVAGKMAGAAAAKAKKLSASKKTKKEKVEVELDEGPFNKLPVAAKTLAKYAAKDKGGMDYDVFMWAAGMMKTGKVKELAKYTMKQDTDPRDKIIDIVKDTLGKAATEKIFPVKIRGEKVELDEVVGTDESVERVAIAISFFEAKRMSPSARAKRDALRDIGRDKSKDDDDEVKSTKADRERADRNIINKLKKSADVKGNYEIKFDKGPAKKVPYKLVKFALDKNEKMKPADKLKFQKELERSYIDFLKALKGM